jgi:hypothetical protein
MPHLSFYIYFMPPPPIHNINILNAIGITCGSLIILEAVGITKLLIDNATNTRILNMKKPHFFTRTVIIIVYLQENDNKRALAVTNIPSCNTY